jgi:hypothetical protein
MTMAKARGISNYWTLAAVPEGYLLINTQDAANSASKMAT